MLSSSREVPGPERCSASGTRGLSSSVVAEGGTSLGGTVVQ